MNKTTVTPAEVRAMEAAGELTASGPFLTRGYVGKKHRQGITHAYKGKHGTGFKILAHNPDSTRFCHVTYYTA